MQRQVERCNFIMEFTNEVLIPLRRTPLDPFSSHKPSVDAFGWAFAAASSRAFRNPKLIDDVAMPPNEVEEYGYGSGKVIIPLLDIASHSIFPNCHIVLNHDRTAYDLRTIKPIEEGEEILIDYGPLGNEELFGDYGFSIDNNPHDKLMFKMDSVLIDTSRCIMGQSLGPTAEKNEEDIELVREETVRTRSPHAPPSLAPIGSAVDESYDERWLHKWQLIWLRALGLQNHCPGANFGMTLTSSIQGNDGMDGRAYAFLRVLYAKREVKYIDFRL